MTVEQKAKAYDKALEKAKIWQEHLYDVNDKDYADELNYIFPELSESEDEKIRKDILCYFEHYAHDIKGADLQKWIAWLEKQGEQNQQKFKIGDWVVFNNRHQSIYQVEKIEDGYYILRHIHGGTYRVCVLHDKSLRFWTIQDAKDGDVLAGNYGTFILMDKSKGGYCGVLNNNTFIRYTGNNEWTEDLHPATKEQRDLLFQKMKEAGWEVDFEKKELKKIEVFEKACNAYCKVCGHYPHTVPIHICRKNCDYFSDFKKYMED